MMNETIINILFTTVGIGTVLSITQIILNNKLSKMNNQNKFKFGLKIKNQYE